MCTAITFNAYSSYFGRNLDLEYRYDEKITVTPRNFKINYRHIKEENCHYAIIGMATVADNFPLYYDGVNEYGLAVAGLNFVDNAKFNMPISGKINIATFEFIPYILGKCKNIKQAKEILRDINITNTPFSNELPIAELHWIIADKNSSIVVEQTEQGLNVYPNDVGVLTNNPPFLYQIQNLNNYLNLTVNEPENRFSKSINLKNYSNGMGSIGLPGDLSSMSRFVRGVYYKLNSYIPKTENESISQYFHILSSVSMTAGLVRLGDKNEKTVYSSCMDLDKIIYYCKTYENSQINRVYLFGANYKGEKIFCCDVDFEENFRNLN